jgi:uncharacterized delta-60 repeat protein
VVLQQDGRIVVSSYGKLNNAPYSVAVGRFHPDGNADQSFGQNGAFRPVFQNDAFAMRLLQQQDGKLVVVGHVHNGADNDFFLARANAQGQVDSQFGDNGVVTTDLAAFGGKDEKILAATLQNDGKIVVAGATDANPQQPFVFSQVVLARYETGSGGGGPTPTATATTEPTPATPTPTTTPGGTIPPTPTATPTLPSSDESTTAQPDQEATLDHTSPDGGSTQVTIPAGAVDQPTTFLYTEEETMPDSGGRFRFAGRLFTLTAYQNNTAVDGFTFALPVTVAIEYTDADVGGLDEANLTLFYYNSATGHWSDDGITVVARDLANNRITLQITHLTAFALGEPNKLIFLPQVHR